MARDVVAGVLVGAGVAVQLLAVAGVCLMRGPLDRLHYTSATTVSVVALSAAVVVRESASLIAIKAVLLAAFMLVSSPVLVHATARAIHLRERK